MLNDSRMVDNNLTTAVWRVLVPEDTVYPVASLCPLFTVSYLFQNRQVRSENGLFHI